MDELARSFGGALRETLLFLHQSLQMLPHWVVVAVLLGLLALAGWAVQMVLMSLLRSIVPQSQRIGLFVLRRVRLPMLAAAVIVTVAAGLPLLPLEPGTVTAAHAWLLVGFVGSLGWMLAAILRGLSDASGRRYVEVAEADTLARHHFDRLRSLRRGAIVSTIAFTAATATAVAGGPLSAAAALAAGAVLVLAAAAWRARSVLANLAAGALVALTRPVRVEDTVTLGEEWGWVEEIAPTYVIVRAWDWRRLTLPLTHFLRTGRADAAENEAVIRSAILWHVSRSVSADRMNERLRQLVRSHPAWDGTDPDLQVLATDNGLVKMRATISARTPADAWILRCDVREQMIAWLQHEDPDALPKLREEVAARLPSSGPPQRTADEPSAPPAMAVAAR